jgi:tricorn protease
MEIYTVDLDRHKSPGAAASVNAALPAGVSLPVTIDASGIERRARQLVSDPTGSKGAMAFAPDGSRMIFSAAGGVYAVPVTGGSATRLAEGVGGAIRLTRDGSAMYTLSGRSGLVQRVEGTGGTPTPVPFRAAVSLDLNEQQRQAFDQAWRMMRDGFYDPKMHGVDWKGVHDRYRPIVDECVTIQDFHLLLTEMIGELNASHTGASRGTEVKVPGETAQLGLWFDWSHAGPGLLVKEVLSDGPADQDESRIRPGEYVVAIAGQDAAPVESVFRALAGHSGQSVDLLVNSRPERNGARTVRLTPASRARFTDLLYEQWVERNRAQVERLSGGRLAYVHIREMKPSALQRFERELLTYAYGKEGVVVDVRFNPGGRIHDELFALLTRKVHVFETPRDALKMTQPFGAFTRPSILLINQGSFSDAEIFANGFRANGLGKIVGVPTGGGVIGTTNVTLLDGETEFRLPRTGWNALDGTNLENYGVLPDFNVEYLPSDLAAGRDPQIEKAVTEMLKGLKAVKH